MVGAILFVAGLIDHWVVAPKSALCQSGIGQIGQAIDTTVAHDCGLVNALEAAVGWLLVLGVLAVIFGVYVIYNSRATAQPVPAAPWSGPPSPYAAAAAAAAAPALRPAGPVLPAPALPSAGPALPAAGPALPAPALPAPALPSAGGAPATALFGTDPPRPASYRPALAAAPALRISAPAPRGSTRAHS